MRTDYETIRVDVDGGVVTITLNRPEHRNAVNLADGAGARRGDVGAPRATTRSARSSSPAPARSFCSGIDMTEGGFGEDFHEQHDRELGVTSDTLWKRVRVLGDDDAGHRRDQRRRHRRRADASRSCSTSASSPRTPSWRSSFTRLGVAPDANANWLVPRLVGLERALDLLMSGRMFSGRDAVEWGLCSRALPAADVLAAAQEFAHDIADNTAPLAVAVTKRLIHEFIDAVGPSRTRSAGRRS